MEKFLPMDIVFHIMSYHYVKTNAFIAIKETIQDYNQENELYTEDSFLPFFECIPFKKWYFYNLQFDKLTLQFSKLYIMHNT